MGTFMPTSGIYFDLSENVGSKLVLEGRSALNKHIVRKHNTYRRASLRKYAESQQMN